MLSLTLCLQWRDEVSPHGKRSMFGGTRVVWGEASGRLLPNRFALWREKQTQRVNKSMCSPYILISTAHYIE